MSLRSCKECGHKVSSRADACPGCGCGVRPKQYGCGHLLVILLGIGFVAILFNQCGDAPSSPRRDHYVTSSYTGLSEEKIAAAEAAGKKAADDGFARRLELKAERLIKAKLKDPTSFQWAGVGYTDNKTLGFVIFGSFRARNSFGGATLTRFIYGGGTLLLEGEAGRFEEAWEALLRD